MGFHMTHKWKCAGHKKAYSYSSQYCETGSVTKQQHDFYRCLVTHTLRSEQTLEKLLFRAMTSPPPSAIVDGVNDHGTAMT